MRELLLILAQQCKSGMFSYVICTFISLNNFVNTCYLLNNNISRHHEEQIVQCHYSFLIEQNNKIPKLKVGSTVVWRLALSPPNHGDSVFIAGFNVCLALPNLLP